MEKFIPYVTTALTLAAFFFALYFRFLTDQSRKGLEQIDAIKGLPGNVRLEAFKVAINVFDLDLKALSSTEQFELAKRMLERRERDSQRRFHLLIFAGCAMLIISLSWMYLSRNSGAMVRAALQANKSEISQVLRSEGFFEQKDPTLADALADSAYVDQHLPLFKRVQDFQTKVSGQPLLNKLRRSASNRLPPFQEVGDIVNVGVPAVVDQPPRYIAYVRRGSSYDGQVILIRRDGGREDQYLRLFARGAITSDSDSDVQLNNAQYKFLAGDNLNQKNASFVIVSDRAETARDPSCPTGPVFSIATCDKPEVLKVNEIPGLVR